MRWLRSAMVDMVSATSSGSGILTLGDSCSDIVGLHGGM
jgi:hypothetical protein